MVLSDSTYLKTLHLLSDQDIADRLLKLKGIGPWSVEMFLIFGLGRLNILPIGDLGLRTAIHRIYETEDLPNPEEIFVLAQKWEPYRTVATWYLWRSLEFYKK